MGADFIRRVARTFQKSWDKGRVALATADLFTKTPECAASSVAADIASGVQLRVGEHVSVENGANGLVAKKGLTEVAFITNPPKALLSAIENSCGIAKGTIEEVYEQARVAEISLC